MDLVKFIEEQGFTCAVSVLPTSLVSLKTSLYTLPRMELDENFNKFKMMLCGLWGDIQPVIRRN